MDSTFKSVEEQFNGLKARFQAGGITRQEFIDEMKKLRLKDEEGRFWMIGAQSGKWYFFDGRDWVQAEPPTQKSHKAICVFCGFENKIEAEVCGRCGGTIGAERNVCPDCGGELQPPFLTCPRCPEGPAEVEVETPAAVDRRGGASRFVLRSIQPLSLLYFGGLLGALLGVGFGIFSGATGYFDGSLSFLPSALTELQGKLLGAVIFGLIGGVAGFVVFALAGLFKAVVLNFVLSLTGGIKFTTTESGRPEAEGPPSEADGP
ncbi:MAG: zinc ribbon domain-containing protein [Candidatus Aminicenantes bacterium]|nr:zinc ribbon domain-containing protein [Candidatus Aminicenantes bacterium]